MTRFWNKQEKVVEKRSRNSKQSSLKKSCLMLISCIWKYLEKHLPIFVERAEPEEPDEGVEVQLLVLDGSASDGPTPRCSKSGN
jgi:hypothetical protein